MCKKMILAGESSGIKEQRLSLKSQEKTWGSKLVKLIVGLTFMVPLCLLLNSIDFL
ncbi:hypothetical protein UFO1_1456 [Pelosinus sp. UFO1]|nr:hypothetical protein UFO1_1456 [Pelosinus sp. UFO1]